MGYDGSEPRAARAAGPDGRQGRHGCESGTDVSAHGHKRARMQAGTDVYAHERERGAAASAHGRVSGTDATRQPGETARQGGMSARRAETGKGRRAFRGQTRISLRRSRVLDFLGPWGELIMCIRHDE